MGEESNCSVGDAGSIPGLGRSPGGRNDTHFLPKQCRAQSSLAGYSPKGCKGSDMTMHAYNLHGNHTILALKSTCFLVCQLHFPIVKAKLMVTWGFRRKTEMLGVAYFIYSGHHICSLPAIHVSSSGEMVSGRTGVERGTDGPASAPFLPKNNSGDRA